MKRYLTLATLIMTLAPAIASAQHDAQMSGSTYDTQCTLCKPYLYLEGGALFRDQASAPNDKGKNTGIVRGMFEVGTPLKALGIFSDVEFTPVQTSAPRVNYGLRLWILPRFQTFSLTAGIGGTNRPEGAGEEHPGEYRTRGWAEATASVKVPVHTLTLYTSIGSPLANGSKVEFQVGLRHPLAPYNFRLLPLFGKHSSE